MYVYTCVYKNNNAGSGWYRAKWGQNFHWTIPLIDPKAIRRRSAWVIKPTNTIPLCTK